MNAAGDNYSESKYSVESVSGKYLENGWSYQHRDFSIEFVTTSHLTYQMSV